MLIVYTLYTLYCLYSTHELYYHRARWLGVSCTCAYMVLASYWGLYIAGILLWTCLASGVGVALLTCWVLLDVLKCCFLRLVAFVVGIHCHWLLIVLEIFLLTVLQPFVLESHYGATSSDCV
jgi:hypothetical protein